MSDARNTAKSTDADLKLLNEKIHYLGQYLSTKATYKEFLQAGNKKMYRSAHQDEIARYEEAVQFLKRNSTNGTILNNLFQYIDRTVSNLTPVL